MGTGSFAHQRQVLDEREEEVNRTARDRRRIASRELERARKEFVRSGGQP